MNSLELCFKLTNLLAQGVWETLASQKGVVVRPFEIVGPHPSELLKLHDLRKISLRRDWNSKLIAATDEEFEKLVKDWTRAFVAPMADGFHHPMQFFELELPKGTFAVQVVEFKGVWIRSVVDYSIDADAMLIRFDSLVKFGAG